MAYSVVFAGSFLHYSALVLEGLLADPRLHVVAVLTTPPHPQGRTKALTPNPVHLVAQQHHVPVLTPSELTPQSLQELETIAGSPSELLVTAGYGKLLPPAWLSWSRLPALNLHFSLLPKFRGANPTEWALLLGETETGVTLIEMSPEFDTGRMVAQARLPLRPSDTRESVYDSLYHLGGAVLPEMLAWYVQHHQASPLAETLHSGDHTIQVWSPAQEQAGSPTPYAQRLDRDDGRVSWSGVQAALNGQTADERDFSPVIAKVLHSASLTADATFVERMIRALAGYPSVWTDAPTAKGTRRLKILTAHLQGQRLVIDSAQLEGQQPAAWAQLKTAITV